MNQISTQFPADVQSHMATTHAQPPTSGPASLGGHYSAYQAPMMHHGPGGYGASPAYGYPYPAAYSQAPVSSSISSNLVVAHPSPLSSMQQNPPVSALPGTQNHYGHTIDQTGQIAPPGAKPRVTATLWEDEGSLCFQVEAKGVCVARREDNHFINGTKLLNVAGMTRGRRDGILKSEKTRHVVKIGPMHLKGVWIPYERALEFANREKITEYLYPLFVHDIGALLYHPSNPSGASSRAGNAQNTLAAIDRRRNEARMAASIQGQAVSGVLVSPVAQTAGGRPSVDRTHNFPTPPSSAVGISAPGAGYESWSNNMAALPGSQSLSIDTSITNQRSMPNTPASTPPGKTTQGTAHYATPSYETSRPVYPSHTAQGSYPSQQRFSQSLPGFKKDEQDQEADGEYAQAATYGAPQNSYSYTAAPVPNAAEVPRVAEIASPQQNGAGVVTPRTSGNSAQWQGGYPTPNRSNTAPGSGGAMYPAVDNRDTPNGSTDGYYQPAVNGNMGSAKRGREDDDDDAEASKRQRTEQDEGGPVGGANGSPYPVASNRPVAQVRKRS